MPMVRGRFVRWYATFVAIALVSAGAIVCVGYVPTVHLAGGEAVWSMLLGCGVSWVASCAGAIPVARALSARSTQPGTAILASTMLRFLTVLLVVAVLTLGGWKNRNVLVFWVGVSYLLMLVVDTVFALQVMKRVR